MKLSESVRDSILEHAREADPKEACGLLGGRDGDPPVVLGSIRTPNVADNPTRRFEIDPEALLEGHESFEAAGLSLLGFYHSHPVGPSAPSETDRDGAGWANSAVLIASLADREPVLGAWWFTGETFRSIPLETIESPHGADST
ncbi:MAG: M67 family metallopeptidase [Halodesulfurarchaeum sp.]|nr:M67 family metallopeptidase [Halodesulfurarchaeum sp.]